MIERFLAKVRKGDGCWEWTGSVGSHGYGQIRADKDDRRTVLMAHRAAYELLVGPIPTGLQIDHLCRNKLCVNPEHLEAVTQRMNILRGDAPNAVAVRELKCMRGHYKEPNRACLPCSRVRWAKKERTPEQMEAARIRARAWYWANKTRRTDDLRTSTHD